MQQRVLIVEDERIVAFNIQQRLAKLGYDVPAVASSGQEALRLAQEIDPDLVLMDIRIEGELDGIETAALLNQQRPVPVVYLTAHSEDATLERARATHPYGYLLKPFSEREMHATVKMAIERWEVEATLNRSEERLRLALDAAEMGILALDPKTRRIEFTGHAAKILELRQGESIDCEVLLSAIDEADRDVVRAALEDCLQDVANYRIEFRRTAADGSKHWIRTQGKTISHGRHGDRLVSVLQDVTDLKQAEAHLHSLNDELESQVALRTAELRANIAELDSFSYSVAHDLRAPVRAIVSFSEILLDSTRDRLDTENAHFLSRVHVAAKHMAELIDALLGLSRITRTPMLRRLVNLSDLATDISGELQERQPKRHVRWLIAPNVVTEGDPALLRIALTNLIGNAWKFTAKHSTACIEFGSVVSDSGKTIYFVRDDGAGFDMTYAGKLFAAFQRQHKVAEFEGTGVGLATVQRIVQRHGGAIWAEAGVEIGACFYFTLSDSE